VHARSSLTIAAAIILALTANLLIAAFSPAAAASTYLAITGPAAGATVHSTVTIATTESADVSWINVYVDRVWVASNPPAATRPYSVMWNSATVADGVHTISVTGYNSNNAPIASAAISIVVQNHAPTPTPTPSTYVRITSPADGATVSGVVTIVTAESANVSWINVYVDGAWVASNPPTALPPYRVTWDSRAVTNGRHIISVTGYNSNNAAIASAAITVSVQNSLPTPTPSPRPTPTPIGGVVFYVAPTGSDSNPGTASAPWRTIQKAAGTLRPGQRANVAAGSYYERVTITSSGTAAAPIVLQAAAGAKMLGFNISGSYWTVSGFDISTQTNGTNGFGIYLSGKAGFDTLASNYIHELCHDGIFMEPGVTHITVTGNRVWRAEMSGILVNGTYDLIQRNEVWETQQMPARLGGIYAGCQTPSGSDADGIRFFGQNHDLRSNYIHDTYSGTRANPDPHVDCFQTWGSAAMKVDQILLERNWCRWPAASNSIDNGAAMIEGLSGPVGTVTFQNNVFADMQQGINVGSNVAGVRVWNNTWQHIIQEAVIFRYTTSAADQIINNIFYDVGSGQDSYACIPAGNPTIAANDFFMPGAPVGTYCSNAPYVSLNPMFVNYGNLSGLGADYHLQSSSPVKDAGVTLNAVTNDYDGLSRPIGPGYSMGAFER
jgi:chloramphenicol 3-O-phosphotransferase